MYEKFLRKIYPLILKITRNDYWEEYQGLRKRQRFSFEKIKEIQWKKLKAILNHAYENVPMYYEKFKESGIKPEDIKRPEDMVNLPIITKDDFRKYFPNKTTAKNISKSNWIPNSTSGSTGQPLEFIIDKDLLTKERARVNLGYEWAGLNLGEKFIIIWGSHQENLIKYLHRKIFRRALILSAFNMTDKIMGNYIKTIKKYKPEIIQTYTSAIVNLSKFIKKNNISINNLNGIITSGETLTETHRKLIESAFNCKVFNRYGSREFGCVAHECEAHEGLHVMAESFFLEFIKYNKWVNEGELGKIIITNFDNYTMPFIRYDIGDMGIPINKMCSCGRGLPLIKSIEGRITEFIPTPSGKLVPYLYFNYFFEQYGKYIKQFQVIQENIDLIKINIIPDSKFNLKIEEKIKQDLQNYLEVKLEIKKVNEILLTKAGKQISIISKLSKDQF